MASAIAAACHLFRRCRSALWWTAGAPREADCDCPAPPEVLAKEPACSLVSEVSPGLQLPLSCPYGSGCLSPAGDGLQPALSVLSFVLCSVLAVSYVQAFRVVAIPQSGLLAQVRSFWLHVGCSCPIFTKHCSLRLPHFPALPHFLVVDAGVCAAFPLGELLLGL